MQAIDNSDNPDLARFRDRAGRLLMYHGWADAIVTPYKTIDYVERVTRALGGPERAGEFLRLFMVPGFDYCGVQQGPAVADTGFDMLTALENWVEKGQQPTSIVMTRRVAGGQPLWSQPLCPLPAARAARRQRGSEGRSELRLHEPLSNDAPRRRRAGLPRLRCGHCGRCQWLASICTHFGFCPSRCARRLPQTKAHGVDPVAAQMPLCQRVLLLPIEPRFLLAARPQRA
jgi:ferredoxin